MAHNQVKWTDSEGNVRFGHARPDYDELAKKHLAKGELVVNDAVLPVYDIVAESEITDIPFAFGHYDFQKDEYIGGDELRQYVAGEFKKAKATAAKVKGVVPGAMFSIGVADGLAFYVVLEVKGNRAKIEQRNFGGDNYCDHHFKGGGWFSVKSLEPYIRWQEKP
jgi:hypothetical protein